MNLDSQESPTVAAAIEHADYLAIFIESYFGYFQAILLSIILLITVTTLWKKKNKFVLKISSAQVAIETLQKSSSETAEGTIAEIFDGVSNLCKGNMSSLKVSSN